MSREDWYRLGTFWDDWGIQSTYEYLKPETRALLIKGEGFLNNEQSAELEEAENNWPACLFRAERQQAAITMSRLRRMQVTGE